MNIEFLTTNQLNVRVQKDTKKKGMKGFALVQ